MTYFIYNQNNSGGSFSAPAVNVVIKAETAHEADAIAMENGIYFDPEFEIDCDCCGNRWSSAIDGYVQTADEIPAVSEWDETFAKWDDVPAQIVIG